MLTLEELKVGDHFARAEGVYTIVTTEAGDDTIGEKMWHARIAEVRQLGQARTQKMYLNAPIERLVTPEEFEAEKVLYAMTRKE